MAECVLTYEALYSLEPRYLKTCLFLRQSAHPLRSSREGLLLVPSPVAARKAFSVVTPPGQSTLPIDACWTALLNTFRRAVKTEQFKRAWTSVLLHLEDIFMEVIFKFCFNFFF